MALDLPLDHQGVCMVCKINPPDADVLLCSSCSSPWHMQCLHLPPRTVPLGNWSCPDCSLTPNENYSKAPSIEGALVAQIKAIEHDENLSQADKARKRQELMVTNNVTTNEAGEGMDEKLICLYCLGPLDRPVTTPCGHNFCLKCLQRWFAQGKKQCGKCRTAFGSKFISQPRINSVLVMAIRMAKSTNTTGSSTVPRLVHYIRNENRPDKAFVTDRAKKTGKANACSGKIFVTTPPDHFGPILAENDPVRSQGVLVGETWADRMDCRQWGVHLPHVAGISGQSDTGAQSVALSGGYEDDEDHGEWFLYTGSGGRDLSGNKRTSKEQSFDQRFDKMNEALRLSCKKGYPVRVVRSHKEKRSSYAPEAGVRYDGVYRIEMCWRKIGIQGFRVCRYLFVRCDNEPAPWTSDESGDRPRPLPMLAELESATDVTERRGAPHWNWKEEEGVWGWTRPPPASRRLPSSGRQSEDSKGRRRLSLQQKLRREFGCGICRNVLDLPLCTPCGHNFCKKCLVGAFTGQLDVRQRTGSNGRSLRVQKVAKRCPICKGDISEFLVNPQVNREMDGIIQSLKCSNDENGEQGIEAEEKIDISNVIEEVKGQDSEGSVSAIDETTNVALRELSTKYSEYSQDLLRSMLADQGGDLAELTALVKALRQQERKTKQLEDQSANKKESDPTLMTPNERTWENSIIDKSGPLITSSQQQRKDATEPSKKVNGVGGLASPQGPEDLKLDSCERRYPKRRLDKLEEPKEPSKKVDGNDVLSQDPKLNSKTRLVKSEPSTNVFGKSDVLYPDKQENENSKLDSGEGRYPKRRRDKSTTEATERKLSNRKRGHVSEGEKVDEEFELKDAGRKGRRSEEVDEPHTQGSSKASKGKAKSAEPSTDVFGKRNGLYLDKQETEKLDSGEGRYPKRRHDKSATAGTKRKIPDKKRGHVSENEKEDEESELEDGGRKRHESREVDEPHTQGNSKASKGKAKSAETLEPSTNVSEKKDGLYLDKQENENPKLDSGERRYPKRRHDKSATEGTKRNFSDSKVSENEKENEKENEESEFENGGRKRHKSEEVDEHGNSKSSKGKAEKSIPRRKYLLRNKQAATCSNSPSSACGEAPIIILDSDDDFQ